MREVPGSKPGISILVFWRRTLLWTIPAVPSVPQGERAVEESARLRELRTAPLPTALQVLQGLGGTELGASSSAACGVKPVACGVKPAALLTRRLNLLSRVLAFTRVSGNPEGNQRVPSTLSFRKFPGKPERRGCLVLHLSVSLEFPSGNSRVSLSLRAVLGQN